MAADPPKRKNTRLRDFDYSQAGYYFVTICTKDRRCILGHIVGGGVLDAPKTILSECGKVVLAQINEVNAQSKTAHIQKFAIMPNHVHLIIMSDGSSGTPTPTNAGIPSFVSMLKRFTNRKSGAVVWQRGYYDHIIRDEEDYRRIWQYIDDNPAKWAEDEYYSES